MCCEKESNILDEYHFTKIWNCVKRPHELKIIKKAFLNERTRIVILSGPGGIGKSTIANQFAAESNSQCRQVVNLEDKTVSLNNLLGSLQFTNCIEQSVSHCNQANRINVYMRHFSQIDENTIILIDNANTIRSHFLHELLHFSKCRYLITTRKYLAKTYVARQPGITVIPIGKMKEKAAQKMFEKDYPQKLLPQEKELFHKYVYDFFDGNTLAITWVAQMLREQGLSLNGYAEDVYGALANNTFRDNSTDLETSVAKRLYRVFKIAKYLDYHTNDIETRVLRVIKMGINVWFKESFLQMEFDLHNANLFSQLAESGIINRKENPDGYYVSVHPIVAKVLTLYGIKANDEARKIILNGLSKNKLKGDDQ